MSSIKSFFTGPLFNWLWTDDQTGKHSDTTARTWALFGVFFVTLVVVDTRILLAKNVDPVWLMAAMELLRFMSMVLSAGLVAYGGHRIIKRVGSESNPLTDLFKSAQRMAKVDGAKVNELPISTGTPSTPELKPQGATSESKKL